MDGTDENRAEEHPEKGRKPTPHDGDRRAYDGSGTGDGRKMMTEDNTLSSGNEIDIITKRFRWADSIGDETEDSAAEPPTVGVVGDEKTKT